MKVLHVTTNYPSERHPAFGAFVHSQVESLRERGVGCRVFFIDGRGNVLRYFAAWLRLLGHLLTHRYDILHAHHAIAGLLLCLTGAPLFSRCVLSYQNSPSREWGEFAFRLLYPFFRRIILKAPDPDFPAQGKVCVLPNGCPPELFRPMDRGECRRALALEENAFYVLYIDANPRRAALGPKGQKREDRFDAVMDIVRERVSAGCMGAPAASSPTAALSPAAAPKVYSLKLRDIPPEKMPLYYNAADLYLLTSDFEGSPNAVKECLMCNTPVVATPVGDLPFLADSVPGCHVCLSFGPEALADLVLEVFAGEAGLSASPDDLSSPLTRAAVSVGSPLSNADAPSHGQGSSRVCEQGEQSSREAMLELGYGLDHAADRLLELYQELVS